MKKFTFLGHNDLFSHLETMRYISRGVILLIDVFITAIAFCISVYFSNRLRHGIVEMEFFPQYIAVYVALQTVFFVVFQTYSGVLRYSGFADAFKLLFATVANLVFMTVANFIYLGFADCQLFSYANLVIFAVTVFLLLFGLRLGVRTVYDYYTQNNGNITPVMVFGTKTAGIGIAKLLKSSSGEQKYKLTGFIDNKKDAPRKEIMGVKVYALDENTVKNVIAKKARAVIVSPAKMHSGNLEVDLEIFLNNGLQIMILPKVSEWTDEEPKLHQIKSVQIEDLLERPQISISCDNIAESLRGKTVLITGAAGSIGSEIARQTVKYNPKLIVLLDQAETPMHNLKLELENHFPEQNFAVFLGDIRNFQRMDYMMDLYRPDIIYHAAAYKHVPMMEDNPVESVQVNVLGTKTLADLAMKYNAQRFVMISTDKAVNPTNIMGASKRIAEIYVQSLYRKLAKEINGAATKFITTRFGNVLGSNGSVIPLFKHQIETGGPVTVTHPDIIRYFMTIPEACTLVLEACAMGEGGEIFIFDMGNPVKIVNLARKMIRLAGLVPDVDIKIEYTGLRPGEKLYEELLNKKESSLATHNSKIMIAKVQEYDYQSVSIEIAELIKYSNLCKDYLTVSQMKKILPEYKSKNSQYERLDV